MRNAELQIFGSQGRAEVRKQNCTSLEVPTEMKSGSENQEKLPTLYWLPKLHKRPYKSPFIANSSSGTTIELSKLLTSCLTTVENYLNKYYDTCYERDGMKRFWSIKNSNEVLNKLKSKGFKASTLSTYDFSTLHTTLPHHLI